MANLEEEIKYEEGILRLDVTMPVKGYDGKTLGIANEQARLLSNRTAWLKKKLKDLEDRTYVISVNKKSGVVTLTYTDVGAAPATHKHQAAEIITNEKQQFISKVNRDTWDAKQEALVSGKNIKTINKGSVLGSGDIEITPKTIGAAEASHKHDVSDIKTSEAAQFVSATEKSTWSGKQDKLVSSENIKTINEVSVLGKGNISLKPKDIGAAEASHKHKPSEIETDDSHLFVTKTEKTNWSGKQPELVSGKNLRTINKMDLLGEGDIEITPGKIGAAEKQHTHNPNDINTTNEKQFVSIDEKGKWSNKQDRLVSGSNIKSVNGKSVLGSGNMTIGSADVGADAKGTAEATLAKHVSETDPHSQYLTSDRAKEAFVQLGDANKAHGYLKLNEKGQFPAEIAQLYNVRYLVVNNKAKRLAVGNSLNTTICLQTDENRIYYLDGDKDASKDGNWVQGRTTDASSVISVFGRAGIITAETGDYHAGQITETSTRKFVTPTEKTNWNNKQDKLVSGKSIATVFGKPLLNASNITLNDVTKLEEIIADLFMPKEGVELYIDPTTKKIVIKTDFYADNNNNVHPLVMKEVNGATSKVYEYNVGSSINFNFEAYALKRVPVYAASAQTHEYTEASIKKMDATEYPTFNDKGLPYLVPRTSLAVLSEEGNFIKGSPIDISKAQYLTFELDADRITSILPTFTSAEKKNGFTPIADSNYGSLYPWLAFAGPLSENEINEIPNGRYWSNNKYFSSNRENSWLGITSDVPVLISAYSFQTFDHFYWGRNSDHPTGWKFQGRNADTEEWVTLDTRTGQDMKGAGEWKTYRLSKDVSYKQYRVLATEVAIEGARTSIGRMDLRTTAYMLIKGDDGKYYTIRNNKFVAVPLPTKETFDSVGFKTITDAVSTESISHLKTISFITKEKMVVYYSILGMSAQIVINPKFKDSTYLESVAALNYTAYGTGDEDAIKFALTPDGTNWYSLNDANQWYNVGKLQASEGYAKVLIADGTDLKRLSQISKAKLEELLGKTSGAPQLGIAFARYVHLKNVNRVPKTVTVSFDKLDEWVKQSDSSVQVSIYNKSIRFKPASAGDYKFFYKFE